MSRICYKELHSKGSCTGVCNFDHEFDDRLRTDEAFLKRIREEKLSRAGKCVNEYRETGSCRNGVDCTFSHIISDEERENPEFKQKMEDKWNKMRHKKSPSKREERSQKDEHVIQEKEIEDLVSIFLDKLKERVKRHT